MAVTAKFYKFSKRKNSTKQPTGLGTDFSVNLKSGTSLISPTLLLESSGLPDYNYLSFMGYYYFVTDIVSVRNSLWEVYCKIDALATLKSEITSSTQYVCYSSEVTSTWLPDTRIPVLKSTTVDIEESSVPTLFNATGFYVLSYVGKNGCELTCVNRSTLQNLVADLQSWQNSGIQGIVNDSMALGYDFSTVEAALESLGKMSIQTGFIGNAYANAPNCIRSCIWVPFNLADFSTTSRAIYLGEYDTHTSGFILNANPVTGSKTINIPWQYSDWRRGICEDVYLYLPLVGTVSISADSITNASQITVEYSATGTDGVVCYRVKAGSEIIGTYSGQSSANYPIGINQQASAGQLAQSIISGGEKMVNAAINSSVSPISAGAAAVGVAMEGAVAAYNTVDVYNTRNLSCIGGIGGGAGVGLSLKIACYVVSHPTVVNPSAMGATMGRPTMKAMSLSTLSGYCQCANAHVEADVPAPILDAVDTYLNSGFYIE